MPHRYATWRQGCFQRAAERRTVTEIAFAHGFTKSSHFSRTFREHYGLIAREVQAAAAARAAV